MLCLANLKKKKESVIDLLKKESNCGKNKLLPKTYYGQL